MFNANGKLISCSEAISLASGELERVTRDLDGPSKQRFSSYLGFAELIVADGYEVVSEYKKSLTKAKVRCPEGHEYDIKPASFKMGSRCTICSGNSKHAASEVFKRNAASRGYRILEEYKSNKSKVKARCPVGHTCYLTPVDFNKGTRCRLCGTSKEGSKERFESAAKSFGLILLGEYKDNTTKVRARCSKGHEVMLIPSSVKAGRGCGDCANMSRKGGVSLNTLTGDSEYMNDDCFLYVSEVSTPSKCVYKIGISINGHRTRSQIAGSKVSCVLLCKTSRLRAYLSEQLTLSSLKDYRIFVRQYKDNGGTEFFSINPSKIANDILTYINSISDDDAIAILKDLEG